jgi:hypothetical protein
LIANKRVKKEKLYLIYCTFGLQMKLYWLYLYIYVFMRWWWLKSDVIAISCGHNLSFCSRYICSELYIKYLFKVKDNIVTYVGDIPYSWSQSKCATQEVVCVSLCDETVNCQDVFSALWLSGNSFHANHLFVCVVVSADMFMELLLQRFKDWHLWRADPRPWNPNDCVKAQHRAVEPFKMTSILALFLHPQIPFTNFAVGLSQWPRRLELSFPPQRLRSLVWTPQEAWIFCLWLFCVCVVLYVGSGLATGWSPV